VDRGGPRDPLRDDLQLALDLQVVLAEGFQEDDVVDSDHKRQLLVVDLQPDLLAQPVQREVKEILVAEECVNVGHLIFLELHVLQARGLEVFSLL